MKSPLLHPQISAALGAAGHGSKVLIADGNYPFSTRQGRNSRIVFLNLRPGLVTATDVLATLLKAIPVEAAEVMAPNESGPYAMQGDPPIFSEFKQLLTAAAPSLTLVQLERFAFYQAASTDDLCLTIATGEERIYANLLLTIGVVQK